MIYMLTQNIHGRWSYSHTLSKKKDNENWKYTRDNNARRPSTVILFV